MSNPVSYQVLDALRTRLQAISLDGGFNTDAGERVYLGKRRINPDQLDIGPAINIYDTEDEVDEETAAWDESVRATMTIMVDAFIRDVDGEGTELAHLVIQDIFNAALSATDLTLSGVALDLGYAGRTIEYPEVGGDTIAISMEFSSLIDLPYGNI